MAVPRDLEHSRNRARLRERVLFDLADHKIRTVGEISKATGIRPSRVLGILEGDGDEYAFDLSLLQQRAADTHEMFGARVYLVTPEGAREVERLRTVQPRGTTWDQVAV